MSMRTKTALQELILPPPWVRESTAVADVQFRHGVRAVLHLTIDGPSGMPATADDFLARLDASWLLQEWMGRDLELSLVNTLALGHVPLLSWVELMYANALAPWSTESDVIAAREIFRKGEPL